MEDELIFTDAEQTLVDQLVNAIYYPDKQPMAPTLETVIRLNLIAQEKIFSSVVNSVSFQQRQRQDYILGVVLGGQPFAGSDPRLAIAQLAAALNQTANDPTVLNELSHQPLASTVDSLKANAELVNQITLYQAVSEQLVSFEAWFQAKYNVLPFIGLLDQYTPEELIQITQLTQQYIAEVNKLGLEGLLSDIPLTPALDALLQKTNLGVFFVNTVSTGERLRGLTVILTICSAIVQNRSQTLPFSRDKLVDLTASLLARSNVSVLFPS